MQNRNETGGGNTSVVWSVVIVIAILAAVQWATGVSLIGYLGDAVEWTVGLFDALASAV